VLQRHGVTLRLDRLNDAARTFDTCIPRARFNTAATADLGATLQQLSDWMAVR
jgi:hypothetical protein